MVSKGHKLEALQAVRALAFLGIFTSHCGVSELGAWGVSVFLVLSGFVMTYNYLPKCDMIRCTVTDNFKFSVRKIFRLYPLHIITMLLAAFLTIYEAVEAGMFIRLKRVVMDIVINTLLLQTWSPQVSTYFSLNGVSWYLSACVFLYFMFPYILKRISKYSGSVDAVKSIVYVVVFQVTIGAVSSLLAVPVGFSNNFQKWITYILPVYRLGDFTVGCNIAYIYIHKRTVSKRKVYMSFMEMAVLVVVAVSREIYINLDAALVGGQNGGDILCCFCQRLWP